MAAQISELFGQGVARDRAQSLATVLGIATLGSSPQGGKTYQPRAKRGGASH